MHKEPYVGMLDKIPKISLNHCLLDSKRIMQNIQPFSCCYNFESKMGVALSRPFSTSLKTIQNFINHKLLDTEGILKNTKSFCHLGVT